MNNIGTRAGKYALSFDPTVKKAQCDYNLFHETNGYGEWKAKPYNVLEVWRSATGHGAHSMYEEPLFANPDTDLRLQPKSPAQGKGSKGGSVGVDWARSGRCETQPRPHHHPAAVDGGRASGACDEW